MKNSRKLRSLILQAAHEFAGARDAAVRHATAFDYGRYVNARVAHVYVYVPFWDIRSMISHLVRTGELVATEPPFGSFSFYHLPNTRPARRCRS